MVSRSAGDVFLSTIRNEADQCAAMLEEPDCIAVGRFNMLVATS
jgi:hypothetical protein